MVESSVRYDHLELQTWVTEIFVAAGADIEDARRTAEILVRTNLRGIDTHGVSRVSGYVQKIRSGEVNARPNVEFAMRDGILHIDGDGGLGQSVALQAVEHAVERARETSVVTCLIRGSGHLAAIGQFVLEVAERGMIGVILQETPPLMALEGSARPAIGNNPIAFGFPVGGSAPLVFDMATSVVARGNVLQAISDQKTSIPEGWAIGPDGHVTTDPRVALQGAMLPVAGHKGIGLAMLVQVLAGSLTASMTAKSAATYSATSSAGNISAFLMVINPDRIVGRAAFDEHVRQWLDIYLAASGESARYPGQRAAECEKERLSTGIPIAASTLTELEKLGVQAGIPFAVSGR